MKILHEHRAFAMSASSCVYPWAEQRHACEANTEPALFYMSQQERGWMNILQSTYHTPTKHSFNGHIIYPKSLDAYKTFLVLTPHLGKSIPYLPLVWQLLDSMIQLQLDTHSILHPVWYGSDFKWEFCKHVYNVHLIPCQHFHPNTHNAKAF